MDLSNLMEMANKMQEQLRETGKNLNEVQSHGEAGGGMVKVTLNGHFRVVSLHLDPSILAPQKARFIQDLMRIALDQAMQGILKQVQGQFGGLAASMGLDAQSLEGMDLKGLEPKGA